MRIETGVTATGAADQADETAAEDVLTTAPDEGGEAEETIEELEAAAKAGKSIPAKRFQKVYDELKVTKTQFEELRSKFDSVADFLDFIEDLKADGIKSSDDVRKFIENQNLGALQSQRKAAEDKAARDYHAAIQGGKDQTEAYDAWKLACERAEVAFDRAVLKQEQATAKRSSSTTVEAKIKAALKDYPEADEETLRDLAKVPGTDIAAKAKRLHDKELERRVGYTKQKDEQKGTKGPANKSGSGTNTPSAPAPPNPLKDPKGAAKWYEDFKKKNSSSG